MDDSVIRDAHPDCSLGRVLQLAGHLPRGGKDEGVRAWSAGFDGAEHRIARNGVLAELGEVGADQGEVMPLVEMPNLPDPRKRLLVAHHGSERESGVGGIGDHAPFPEDRDDLRDGTCLRVLWMYVEVASHTVNLRA